ncbi:G patch domain and ankyrin repeat-containing protein 1 homolog [Impatiens glandulifera]|uniref:G patch domain and ankyrin repeat-containing protein 1 homolog n=1 Tax=Impatiens glandulifera TaxID=253017 RepID=UPI001FB115B4|nr:G patch domain and ankyrin repeat-containing protein 1 homolog [Impatiens glandulifera]
MGEEYGGGGNLGRVGIGGTDGGAASTSSSSSVEAPIGSSNIGFQLLKKHGWKEGTGLGISEQGRLEPIRAYMKKNKRGLGAIEKVMKKKQQHSERNPSSDQTDEKKAKGITKKTRKRMELEKQMQEKEFEQAFFRDFWPDNV